VLASKARKNTEHVIRPWLFSSTNNLTNNLMTYSSRYFSNYVWWNGYPAVNIGCIIVQIAPYVAYPIHDMLRTARKFRNASKRNFRVSTESVPVWRFSLET